MIGHWKIHTVNEMGALVGYNHFLHYSITTVPVVDKIKKKTFIILTSSLHILYSEP